MRVYNNKLIRTITFNIIIKCNRFNRLFFFSSNPGIPYITDCVMAEIEKLGMKYRVALRYKLNIQTEYKLALGS